jgi:hypothetical protein
MRLLHRKLSLEEVRGQAKRAQEALIKGLLGLWL